MNSVLVFLLLVVTSSTSAEIYTCRNVLKCFDKELNDLVNAQIGVELTGHYTYLYLSQIFDQHGSHFPKVSKYLRDKATEEMSHAERFIQYQNQRGGTVAMPSVTRHTDHNCTDVDSLKKAFKCAMELEAHVTSKLTKLHSDVQEIMVSTTCGLVADIDPDDLRLTQPMLVTWESGSDKKVITWGTQWNAAHGCSHIKSVAYVELAEMIAHEFLGHQVEDTKEIANHYRTLKRLQAANTATDLADFLFDKHLEL